MSKKSTSTHTDWHKAIFCAVQLDLKDYAHLLEYKKELSLSSNNNRIDFLVIKKLSDFQIPKHIASIFRTHNLFEAKGNGSTLTKDAYYKTNGHAGYYITNYEGSNTLDRREVTLTFPTFRYPRKLFKHLTKECNKTIENPFPGVYYILNEMYATQVLVINELYIDYMNQFFKSHKKGEKPMVCEGLLNYFGTSSEEIAEKTREQDRQFYLPQIEELIAKNKELTSVLEERTKLLTQNNITY